ncbi:Small glutamine-rich tetratricopeptide repeat-containing protein 2 [Penicillium macrosclerotiorum]|uniref:Small glutamine-rich tetratricopeptide repeat-containing protein 2 n=1 Tax=Penicillium macrosclerotiorum TaxID=303699 RepID=UPI00254807BF|nr:Small glutamine-rich tetratricopeptide repeat-containing protein 2 [Penicillium macrosclerotiorum]KAJ5698473.1 Small glutamine-rich tetratricopeptide repeat-containing protein 2 [Penicillium macrosclerotiorum]
MAPTESKKRLALAIIDFLGSSLKDGTLTADDAESIEIAQSCIADTFKVDPTDEAAVKEAVGGQSLANIYSVYEKLRNKSTPQSAGAGPEESQGDKPKAGAPTAESDKLKSEGNALMAKKDYNAAIEQYTKALEIAPANPIYLSNRAAAFSASGQHEKAADDAELAVAVDPKYSKAWSRLGLARFDMGDYHAAKEAYEKGIEAEGNGGSEAMKRGLETSKRKIEEASRVSEPPSEELDSASGASRGAGGMPDLSSLASMLGGGAGGAGGGMPDLGSMMNNPMFANMAQKLMSNPDMLNNLMSNPRLREMAQNFGQGGGMPDMSSLMSDPNIADMARNMMGGGGAGRGQ